MENQFSTESEPMKAPVRRQLSLFLSGAEAETIESVRRRLDPVQHALIPAHVTLCRDKECEGLDPEILPAKIGGFGSFVLQFGAAEIFDGHGVRLPCISGEAQFSQLRRAILGAEAIRRETPHITLAHPRNPRADSFDLRLAQALPTPLTLTFTVAHSIEQAPSAPWRVVAAYPLSGPDGAARQSRTQ